MAFLFDLNGTMVDDMGYHIFAWHKIINELGAMLSIDEVKEQCYGKNSELLERVFPGRFTLEEKDKIGLEKEKAYQIAFTPQLKLIDGLDAFLEDAYKRGVKMAIGSAAIPFNINYVLNGLEIGHYFSVIVSADDVDKSKPHPETYLLCAEKLGVQPVDCIVFEDSPKGIESAFLAGMKAVAITTVHPIEDFDKYPNVLFVIEDFKDERLLGLLF